MILADDGTLDTVIECDACAAQFRYNYDAENGEYDSFVDWALDDASGTHQEDLERDLA
jgi:hypothetical protein